MAPTSPRIAVMLQHPDDQPYLPRLSGAGSLRRELEAVLAKAPPATALEGYRRLILEGNAAEKSSASMRLWTWKRLKVRYLLDPRISEFRAFRQAMGETSEPAERGLLAFLMMARTDRLFREVVGGQITPFLRSPGTVIDATLVRHAIEDIADRADRRWSASVIEGTAVHVLTACRDYGLLEGGAVRRTVAPRPGAATASFGIRLARLEGLGDRRALESRWFRLLGLELEGVLELMHRAARAGAIRFRFQADVAEIELPEMAEVVS